MRVITYFAPDVDRVGGIIKKEFTIDWKNSVDKRQSEANVFGYVSLQYIAKLDEKRLSHIEYESFAGLACEIQMRTVLQHAWAEIEHDLGYKSEYEIPDQLRRRFARLAALLELGDSEFLELHQAVTQYNAHYEKCEREGIGLPIDAITLRRFVGTSKAIRRIEGRLGKLADAGNMAQNDGWFRLLQNENLIRLRRIGIENTKQLEELLVEHEEAIRLEANASGRGQRKRGSAGWSLTSLVYAMASEMPTEEETPAFLNRAIREDYSKSEMREKGIRIRNLLRSRLEGQK